MKKIYLLLFSLIMFQFHAQNSCMALWNSFQTFTITNPNASALSDYQVKLSVNTQSLISSTLMNASGNDIRFTVGSCSLIPYYIESGINTTSTSIWVKVPSIPASGTVEINMYFNNTAAPAQSNGDLVFEFFDDFNDNSFNLTKWSVQGTPTSLVETGGVVTFVGTNNWEYFKSIPTFTAKLTGEMNIRMATSTGPVVGIGGGNNRFSFRMNGSNFGTTYDPDVSGGNAWFDVNYPAIAAPSSTFQEIKFVTELTTNTITVSNYCNNSISSCSNTPKALTTYTGTSYFLGFTSWTGNMEVDIFKLRKFATLEPTVLNGTTKLNPYVYTNALSQNVFCPGAITTVSFVSNGTFTTGNNYTAEISDAVGNFTSATSIGVITSTASGSLTVSATIPSTTSVGNGYRIRINASNQNIIGVDNGTNFTITPGPVVNIASTSSAICSGNTVTMTASGASTYSWNTTSTNTSISVSPTVTTVYSVVGTSVGCSTTASFTQVVNPLPTLSGLSSASVLCTGNSATLTASGANTYTWNGSLNGSTIVVSPSVTTTYTLSGTSSAGCLNTTTVTQVVSTCAGIVNSNVQTNKVLIYPNPFTETIQVNFEGKVEITRIVIFNVVGEKIKEIQNVSLKNQIDLGNVSEGIYYLKTIDNNGNSETYKLLKQ